MDGDRFKAVPAVFPVKQSVASLPDVWIILYILTNS